jgi:hypothetical protein
MNRNDVTEKMEEGTQIPSFAPIRKGAQCFCSAVKIPDTDMTGKKVFRSGNN